MRFQVLFHSPPGVLFTFPSRYWFTIGRQEYLALDGGPPGFPHERPSTWYSGTRPGDGFAFAYGAVTLYGRPFQTVQLTLPYPSFNLVEVANRSAAPTRLLWSCNPRLSF